MATWELAEQRRGKWNEEEEAEEARAKVWVEWSKQAAGLLVACIELGTLAVNMDE